MEYVTEETKNSTVLPLWWLGDDQQAILLAALFFLQATGILLNAATIGAFLREGTRRTGGWALPMNLVVADLLTAGFVLPLLTRFVHTKAWPYGTSGCRIFGFTFQLIGSVSINTMTATAIERHYTVTRGQQGTSKLSRQQGKLVLASWFASLLLAAPPLVGWSNYHLDIEKGICTPDWKRADRGRISYIVYLAVFGFILPVGIQAGSYLRLCITVLTVAKRARSSQTSFLRSAMEIISIPVLKLAQRNLPNGMNEESSYRSPLAILLKRQTELQNIYRLARVMISMVLMQVLSWLPYIISLLTAVIMEDIQPEVMTFSIILSTANVIYNPILYVFLNRKYRRILVRCISPLTGVFSNTCQKADTPDEPLQDIFPVPAEQPRANLVKTQVQPESVKMKGRQQIREEPPSNLANTNTGCIFTLSDKPPFLMSRQPALYTIKETSSTVGGKSELPFNIHDQVLSRRSRNQVMTPLGCSSSQSTAFPGSSTGSSTDKTRDYMLQDTVKGQDVSSQ